MRGDRSKEIAKERLKLMEETSLFPDAPEHARLMQKEIADIVTRYYEISPDDYEIKVVVRQTTEKGIRC